MDIPEDICKKGVDPSAAAVITVPGTIVSALINAAQFGGVTSSGSSLLVQLLAGTPLGLTGSIFAVQFFTDIWTDVSLFFW